MNKFKCLECGYTWLAIPRIINQATQVYCPRCERLGVQLITNNWVKEMGLGGALNSWYFLYQTSGYRSGQPIEKWMMD